MIATAEENDWNTPSSSAENHDSEAIREYESRRCRVCRARYPAFGFGPPLIRSGATIWACDRHRAEVDRVLSRERAVPADKAQLTLL